MKETICIGDACSVRLAGSNCEIYGYREKGRCPFDDTWRLSTVVLVVRDGGMAFCAAPW